MLSAKVFAVVDTLTKKCVAEMKAEKLYGFSFRLGRNAAELMMEKSHPLVVGNVASVSVPINPHEIGRLQDIKACKVFSASLFDVCIQALDRQLRGMIAEQTAQEKRNLHL